MTPSHHLAQVNIGRIVAPLDDARLQGFVDGLDPVNAVADAAPGFVWRLQDDDGDATSIRLFDTSTIAGPSTVFPLGSSRRRSNGGASRPMSSGSISVTVCTFASR